MKTKMLSAALLIMTLTSFGQQGVTFFRVLTNPQGALNLTPLMTPQEADAAINAASQSVVFSIELADIASAKVHVKLGADTTAFNIYNQVVNLDGSNLPAGTSVVKNGTQVQITLGSFSGLAHYIAEIEIESAAGIKSRKYQINH